MKCILTTEKDKHYFDGLLPDTIRPGGRHLVFGAHDDEGYALGAIAGMYLEYECSIDWLYVRPEARQCGVATGLLQSMINAVKDLGLCPITARFEADPDNHLYDFFISQEQATVDYLCDRWYVSPKAIKLSPVLSAAKDTTGKDPTVFFFDCSLRMQRMYLDVLSDTPNGYEVADFNAWKKDCVPELCRLTTRDDKLTSCIFIVNRHDGNLGLSYLYSDNSKDMFTLIQSVAEAAADMCPDASLVFDTVNPMSTRLATKVFPKGKRVNMYEASL